MKYSTNQFLTLLTYIALLFVGSILSMAKVTGSAYFLVITIAAVVATVVMIYLTQKSTPNELEESTTFNNKLQWIIVGTIGALVIQLGLGLIDQHIFHASTDSANTMQLLALVRAYPYYFLYVLICAPIMEEIIFRRVFFSNLIKPTNIYWAAAISALFFAFMHQDTRFLIYVAMGLWFSFIYYKSKNIYVSAGSHLVMNTLVVMISFM
ncbi:CPBP family intramembrane metalloprotease [Companilactobacillus allii]|uniref:CAAX protease n=1 Tax=Companilactobacillus allii TaxID=1847728 RepID=A0A1P8PZU5_9LACO|nr:type II CAAX endopeptidase family protein [Companilactobacillus allii]APX71071.1 CAAX protease [Companilactobacillus allii]USQ68148.1 CPBP family intramembrane metalloprotease [Companilactobacillus allii]